ncbi:MAG: anhydro-N-acetylmuramic acid kinase [Burkholderiaceae bacterium]
MSGPSDICIGLMSGTSLDGVDACAVRFMPAPQVIANASKPFPRALRARLLWLAGATAPPPDEDPVVALGLARRDLADCYADTVAGLPRDLLAQASVIGAHGQTIRHHPEHGFSLQLLDGARLAARTGIAVVNDFRSADLALGGQGAPLVPAFHLAAFGRPGATSAVVNIGGIANVSVLAPAPGAAGSDAPPVVRAGFDTGPGNRLLDDWIQHHRGEPFDEDGRWARRASVNPALLRQLRADPYFARPEPKSTGREAFNLAWLQAHLARLPDCDAGDVQATLVELTAGTIVDAIAPYAPDEIIVCGGGARNGYLVQRLAALGAPARCRDSAALGMAAQSVEAAAFAWLAFKRLRAEPANLPASTGARSGAILGALHLPPPPGA